MKRSFPEIVGMLMVAGFSLAMSGASSHRDPIPRQALSPIAALTSLDRILVLAPHEDDETLGTGGLLQQAVAVGAAVRIAYLTYGDDNEMAFILYRKRPWISAKSNLQMGEIRRQEAVQAMAHLGIGSKNLIFLGYPDGGPFSKAVGR